MQIQIALFPALSDSVTEKLFSLFGPGNLLFVGGCVRDALLGKNPQDIDLATPLLPEDVMTRANHAGMTALPTGIKFGTVTVILEKQSYQITTLRRDIKSDGRWAEVEYSISWLEDAARRDFTFNALYMDQKGTITDYFEGTKDLQEGRVRFIGKPEDRIQEDYLRILRFFRFYAWYGKGAADEQALEACTQHAPYLNHLSKERIHTEVLKLLSSATPLSAVQLMQKTGVWEAIFSVSAHLEGFQKLTELSFSPLTRLYYLCQKLPPKEIADPLCFSRKNLEELNTLVSTIKGFEEGRSLYSLVDAYGKFGVQEALRCLISKENSAAKEVYPLLKEISTPPFPLTGKDLMELGFPSGKVMGDALNTCHQWWVENEFKPTKEECISWLVTFYRTTI